MRRRRIPPREDAVCHVSAGRDKLGLDIHYINAFKGRGIFTTVPFQKGDFLLEYRGKLITKEECERRHRVYHDSLKVFMFEFKFDGKLWCVDASQEDGSLGRLVNDNHISPSAKMKILNINGKPHLCLFASRDISPGEEIDYNYGDSDWPWRCKTETSQIQKTVSCLKPQPNNDLDLKHPEPERDLDEEMPQQGSEAMHSSSVQDFEETETSQIQKTVSCLKPQPNNDLDLKHPEPERDLDEEMPQQGSEAMHSSSVQDFEETETSQIQKTVSCLKPQPNNDLDLKHPEPERDLDEEMPQQGSEAMHSSSVQDFEETETSQIQKTVSCLKPQPNSFPNNDLDLKHPEPERFHNHRLVCTTISSLDKCIQCVGPVSSLKWLGYKCKVCLGVWHKSCLAKLANQNCHQSTQKEEISEYSGEDGLPHSVLDQISSDDDGNHSISEEEYVPDSESYDEDSDEDISLLPSTSKGLLCQNDISKAHEQSDSMNLIHNLTKDKPQDKSELCETESEKMTLSKRNYCYFCGKPQAKISRHLKTHKTAPDVVHAFSLPRDSNERKSLLEKLRNKGNFKHNAAVLHGGVGPLKVKRRPKIKAVEGKFAHCFYCQGMYVRKDLWRHVRRCPNKPKDDTDKEPGRTKVLGLALTLESQCYPQVSSGVWKVLAVMKQDEIASAVRNDFTVIQFAQSLYNKHGQDPTKYDYIRQKLREAGRLLLCLRTEFSVHNMEEAIKPANFQRVVQAVKKVSGFDEETLSYKTPSLALKLGHTLHKMSDIIHCRALMTEDEALIKSTDAFKKLYVSKWSEMVSHRALNTLSEAKFNKPSTLPFTEDVRILHHYLQKSAESAFCSLENEATAQNYAQLAQVTLSQIIVFNRRRSGEVSKMRLKSFLERDKTALHTDVAMGLSEMEQRLCNYFCRIEIMGKRDRNVPVLLTPSMLDALSLLVSRRPDCGICATNIYLFARPRSMSHYRGMDSLRVHAHQCGAKQPEYLRSTQLRKHVATLSQVLNLKNNELDQVADFLGHDIRVHREFYRLPVPTTQLAKISKLLLTLEKGHLSQIQGKSLDEIKIEDEIALSDAETKDSESESDDDDTALTMSACGTSEPVHAVADSTNTAQLQDTVDCADEGPLTMPAASETAAPSEEKNAAQSHNSRRAPKNMWSKAEVAAVMRHFKDHINEGKLATKNECSHCKLVEDPVLAGRTVQNIRDFVRNRGLTAKRQKKMN
ncbi:uncharacterized protein LOC120720108 isoform X3 [Simochromis diagramma]|nr:uncharacterized protein LOC120720108 isoform X3 [Simochromis diagramma]